MKVKKYFSGRQRYWCIRMLAIVFFDHLSCGLTAAVMTPSRRTDEIKQTILQGTCFCSLSEKFAPGLEGYDDRIECSHIPGKTILRPFLFLEKSAEQPVPDDQYATVIPIQV